MDPARGLEADELLMAACPAGSIGYELQGRVQNPELIKALNSGYTCLVPVEAGAEALLAALGLRGMPPTLWPSPVALDEARGILANLGWEPAKTLVLLVDQPSILDDPTLKSALVEVLKGPWTIVGVGGKGVTYQSMEDLLSPWNDRSANLTGTMSLCSTAALLQLCGGYIGGTPLLQTMAKACGCASADSPDQESVPES